MTRAVVLGGTGAIGGATAALLRAGGWGVDVTGRDASAMPAALASAGVRFHAVDRADTATIDRLIGDDTALVVDLLAYRAADVRVLLPALARVRQTVLISGRAVYLDPAGNHVNADEPPRWDEPITEDTPTLHPLGEDGDPFTREGYGPGKVAAERAALDSGLPIAALRVSKVHGRWARQARTRPFVERIRAGERTIALRRVDAVDHLSAARNTAALIAALAADVPAARVLNSADPDTPTARGIVRAIGAALDVDVEVTAGDVANPWGPEHPIRLDVSAASRVPGWTPVGTALELIADEALSVR